MLLLLDNLPALWKLISEKGVNLNHFDVFNDAKHNIHTAPDLDKISISVPETLASDYNSMKEHEGEMVTSLLLHQFRPSKLGNSKA